MRNVLRAAAYLSFAGALLTLSGSIAQAQDSCVRKQIVATAFAGDEKSVKQTDMIVSYCVPRGANLQGITASVMDASRLTTDAMILLGAVIAASESQIAAFEKGRVSSVPEHPGAGCPPVPLHSINCMFTPTPANVAAK